MNRQRARRIRIGLMATALALATGVSLAVQTHEVEMGRGGVYDGTVTIGRDAQGRLVFRDADVTTSATLESLVGGGLTSIPDPLVPADGTQNITGAVAATGAISGSNLSGTNTGNVTIATAGRGLSIVGQALSLALATASVPGALSAADWTTFNAKQAASAILTAISNLSSTGLVARTGDGTVAARTIAAGTGINVTNGDGAAGNPTIASSVAVNAGTNVTVSTNGATFTVNATGGGGGTTETVSGGTGVSVTTNGSNYAVAIGQSVATSATPTFAGVTLTGGTPIIGYAWICTSTAGAGYWAPVASASGFSGSGTTNYLAKFTSASTVGSSHVYDNGTNVGVLNTSPVTPLEVGTANTTNSNFKSGSFELQPYDASNVFFSNNAYYNGGFYYRASASASILYFANGEIQLRTFPSGSAGTTFNGNIVQLKVNNDGSASLGGSGSPSVGNYTGSTLYLSSGGNVSIPYTSAPARKLELIDAGNPQFRLTQSASSTFTDFQADNNGNLIVAPSGGKASFVGATSTGTAYAGSIVTSSSGAVYAGRVILNGSVVATALTATTIIPRTTGKIHVTGSGDLTLTSTPTIATASAADGELLYVMNDSAYSITLQDESNLTGSKIRGKSHFVSSEASSSAVTDVDFQGESTSNTNFLVSSGSTTRNVTIDARSGRSFMFNATTGYWIEM
jgi:hypothetical protein